MNLQLLRSSAQNPALQFGHVKKKSPLQNIAVLATALLSVAAQAQAQFTSMLPTMNSLSISQFCPRVDSNQQAIETLKKLPYQPNNIDLLRPDKYGGADPVQPADPGVEPTLDDMKAALTTTFNARYGKGTKKAAAALKKAVNFM